MGINNTIMVIGAQRSGKSTVGKETANILEVPFRDSDLELLKRDPQYNNINELIDGETYLGFRSLESDYLDEELSTGETILFAGGGGVAYPSKFDEDGIFLYEEETNIIANQNLSIIQEARRKFGLLVVHITHSFDLSETAREYDSRAGIVSDVNRTNVGPTFKTLSLRDPYFSRMADVTLYTKGLTIEQEAEKIISINSFLRR